MRKLDDDTYRICRLYIMSYRQPIPSSPYPTQNFSYYYPQGFKKFYPRYISAEPLVYQTLSLDICSKIHGEKAAILSTSTIMQIC